MDLVLQILEIIFPPTPKLLSVLPKTASDPTFIRSPSHPLLCPQPLYITMNTSVLLQHLSEPSKFLVRLHFPAYIRSNQYTQGKKQDPFSCSPGAQDHHLKPEGMCHSSRPTFVPFQMKVPSHASTYAWASQHRSYKELQCTSTT